MDTNTKEVLLALITVVGGVLNFLATLYGGHIVQQLRDIDSKSEPGDKRQRDSDR